MTYYTIIARSELDEQRLSLHTGPPAPYVLVVDDDEAVADTLTTVLRTAGYGVATAYDAETALLFAELVPPQILISDICLPGMDGFEFAVRICRLVADCDVLLMSAHEQLERVAAWRSSGYSFRFLQKPFSPASLLHELATVRTPAQARVSDPTDGERTFPVL